MVRIFFMIGWIPPGVGRGTRPVLARSLTHRQKSVTHAARTGEQPPFRHAPLPPIGGS